MRKLSSNCTRHRRDPGIVVIVLAACALHASSALAADPGAPLADVPPPALADQPGNATRQLLPVGSGRMTIPRSVESKVHSNLRFENRTGGKIVLYWIDPAGEKKRFGGVPAGKARRVNTYLTHVWLVTDEANEALGVFRPEGADSVAEVHAALRAEKPADEATLRSVESKVAASIRFVNQTPNLIHLYWLDYDGRRNLRGRVPSHESLTLETFVSHPWVVTTEKGETLAVFRSKPGEATAVVEPGEVQP